MKSQYLGRYSVADSGITFLLGSPIEGMKVRLRRLYATVRTAVSAGGTLTLTVQAKDLDGGVTTLGSVNITEASSQGDKVTGNGGGDCYDADEIQVAVSTSGGPVDGEADLWVEFEWRR